MYIFFIQFVQYASSSSNGAVMAVDGGFRAARCAGTADVHVMPRIAVPAPTQLRVQGRACAE